MVESGQPLVVVDARADDRVKNNLAIRDLGVIAYLGMPVCTDDGYLLGSFCAIQTRPRQWSDQDRALMADLSAMVSAEVWRLQRNRSLADAVRLFEDAERERVRERRMLAHDLRTPIAAMLSCLELLGMTEPAPTAEQVEYLKLARESGETLNGLVADLITAPGEIEADMTCVTVSSLLRRSASVVRPLVEKYRLTLSVTSPEEGQVTSSKAQAMARVLLNLLTNAVKFSPPGGEISLSVRPFLLDGRDGFRFEVGDRGQGVSASEKESIFRESVTGSAARRRGPESHGLGLAYCKFVAIQLNGAVGVEDRPGGGSLFYFFLPA